MLVNHRPLAPEQTEYTMAMDKVEFIAIQCAVRNALELIKESGDPFTENGINLGIIYAALDVQLHHPNEL